MMIGSKTPSARLLSRVLWLSPFVAAVVPLRSSRLSYLAHIFIISYGISSPW
jgi:hypothetical protein